MLNLTKNQVLMIGAVVVFFVVMWNRRNQKDQFTRTCLTADTNCKFVRSPVDYVYKTQTEIPDKVGRDYPHLMARPTDKLHPLEDGPINLIQDEAKLWNPKLLWEQYTHDYPGCGNGKEYIVNDEKTRWTLEAVGDIGAARMLYSMRSPQHGPRGIRPALTEQDLVRPDPFDRSYGGSNYLNDALGD